RAIRAAPARRRGPGRAESVRQSQRHVWVALKNWPALDFPLPSNTDRLLAAIDDFSPTAIEERPTALRVFFASLEACAAAQSALTANGFAPTPVDISDEDWARRSQEALGPITVGRITVAPPWASQSAVSSP